MDRDGAVGAAVIVIVIVIVIAIAIAAAPFLHASRREDLIMIRHNGPLSSKGSEEQ